MKDATKTSRSQAKGHASKTDQAKIAGKVPSAAVIGSIYTVLGVILSYSCGKNLSKRFVEIDDVMFELAPTIIILSLFLVRYSLYDVMAVGRANEKYDLGKLMYPGYSHFKDTPEEVYLALRAQTNQVEQLPSFIFASISFSLCVNGLVGAILSLTWVVLRSFYSSTFRAGVGIPFNKIGLGKFTVPAYFILNAMLMGTVVHCVRFLTFS